jgi:hypothetical protein
MARQKEMAIRAALGAGPTRLAGQSLVESLLLSLMGGALGAALAVLAVRSAPSIRGFYIPRLEEITVDGRVLIAAAAAALVSSLLFGMAPAWRSGRMDPAAVMQQGGGFGGPSGGRLRNALVVAQLALAFMLLSGAGLMANTLMRLLHIDLGFERDHVVTIGTSLPYPKYDTTRSAEFLRTLAAEVRRMPGVTRASASDYLPLQAVLFPYELRTERGGTAQLCEAMARDVDTDYFATIRIPLLAGRDFRKGDDTRTPIPVVINRTASGLLFGEENPVGREILTNYRERRRLEVIGVAGDSHQLGLTRSPGPQLYLPLVRQPELRGGADGVEFRRPGGCDPRGSASDGPVCASAGDQHDERPVLTRSCEAAILPGLAGGVRGNGTGGGGGWNLRGDLVLGIAAHAGVRDSDGIRCGAGGHFAASGQGGVSANGGGDCSGAGGGRSDDAAIVVVAVRCDGRRSRDARGHGGDVGGSVAGGELACSAESDGG